MKHLATSTPIIGVETNRPVASTTPAPANPALPCSPAYRVLGKHSFNGSSGARWDTLSDSGWVWRAAASVEGTSSLLERLSQPAPVAPRRFAAPRGQRIPYPEAP